MGCRRAATSVMSNVTEPGSDVLRSFMAASAASESSGCIRMKDMPVFDQSVLRKVGSELSYRRRSGSETRAVFSEGGRGAQLSGRSG